MPPSFNLYSTPYLYVSTLFTIFLTIFFFLTSLQDNSSQCSIPFSIFNFCLFATYVYRHLHTVFIVYLLRIPCSVFTTTFCRLLLSLSLYSYLSSYPNYFLFPSSFSRYPYRICQFILPNIPVYKIILQFTPWISMRCINIHVLHYIFLPNLRDL